MTYRNRNYNKIIAAAFAHATPSPTGWYRVACPLCLASLGKEDRRQSLAIFVGTWKWHCFRCGKSGRLPYPPTGLEDAEQAVPDPIDPAALNAPEGFLPLAEGDGFSAMSFRPARKYLASRHVSRETCRALGIGATLVGKAAHRIIVPVKVGNEWLGWVARSWFKNASLRYLYPRGMPRREILFNSAALLRETRDPAIIVEGVFDALPHYPHAVACLGKPTDDQLSIMLEAKRPLMVVLDGDAWREGRSLATALTMSGKNASFVRLPPLTDPGDFSFEELNKFAHEQSDRL
jgi:hypothetical protein